MTETADRGDGAMPAAAAAELARLRAENQWLRKLAGMAPDEQVLPRPAQAGFFDAPPGPVHHRSPLEQKVAFFGALFAARTDVYARAYTDRDTGRPAWAPAARGRIKGVPHAQRNYLPLTPAVLSGHLMGDQRIGLYPLLDGDQTWWLAADFDGPEARFDAVQYLKAARALGVPAAIEVSRSGTGAHAWVFFTAPVPAATARKLGTGLLREAMALRGGRMKLTSYDRLFPSQDLLPAGGVGNLIAAPLFKPDRDEGRTVFINLETQEPHRDQFAFLSSLGRMTPREVSRAADQATRVQAGAGVTRLAAAVSTQTRPVPAPVIRVRLGAGIRLEDADLVPAMAMSLRHAASRPNPEFYDNQRRRLSTWNKPRFLFGYDETLDGGLILPRGLLDQVTAIAAEAGSRVEITDERSAGTAQDFTCSATLTSLQQAAVDDLRPHDTGILVAPPAEGKTVMACALIAAHATSTLILVSTTPLARHWRDKTAEFLGVTTGQLGAGRKKLTGSIDIMMLQTLARRSDTEIRELTAGYGLIVTDECHHVAAKTFTAALKPIPARRWLSLTATPYRRDKLEDLIFWQLGKVRHVLTPPRGPARAQGEDELPGMDTIRPARPAPVLHVHRTSYRYAGDADPHAPGGMAEIYRDVVADAERNRQITADVLAALGQGRNCLILSSWVRHLTTLTDALRDSGYDAVTLRGSMRVADQDAARARLARDPGDRDAPPLLVAAIASFAGEGFDCPALDTMFLAFPMRWKGDVEQYVGRILRPYPGKATAEVHDYYDAETGVLANMLKGRAPGYTKRGFPDPRRITPSPPPGP